MSDNLFHLLLSAAQTKGESTFFFYRKRPISYALTLDMAGRLAAYLKKMGITRGDRILLQLGNVPEFIYSYFASAQIGAIVVLVNPAAGPYELRNYCDHSAPGAIITTTSNIPNYKINDSFFVPPENMILADELPDAKNFWNIVNKEKPLHVIEEVEDEHISAIIYTSAMDGFPLGAMLTNRGIYRSAKSGFQKYIDKNDIFISILPLFHSYGLTSSLFIPMCNGVPFYLMDRFKPDKILDVILKEKISVVSGVPVLYKMLNKNIPKGLRFPAVKAWISGGESLSLKLQQSMMEDHGIEIRQGYGCTEASPIITWNSIDRPNVFGSVGHAMSYNTVKISGDGIDLPPNEAGEILVKGINVIPGYYKHTHISNTIIKDGWLHTGDIGYADNTGNFFITGRKKNMIIKNGFNVYPREVENILSNHPSVESVLISGHFDKNEDNTFNESIEACLYRKKGHCLTEKSFLDWCYDNISSYKIPTKIKII